MTNRRSLKKFIIVMFLIVLPGVISVPTVTAAFRYIHEGMKIPALEGKDVLTSQNVSSNAYLEENNMLVIVFWATWSKRSLDELSALKEISSQFKEKPVKIIAVNVDHAVVTDNKRKQITKIISDMDLPFPTIIDNNLELFYSFGVIAVPSTAITDSTGIIRYGPAGYSLSTRDFIVDSIEVLLGLKDVSDIAVARKGYTPNNKALRYYNLGLNMRHKRLFDRAMSNLSIAIENDSGFPVPYSLIGELKLISGDTEDAIFQYQKATTLDSEFVAAWAGLGEAYYKNNQLDSSEICLKKALSLDENFVPAFKTLNLVLCDTDRPDSALHLLLSAQELNPTDMSIEYYLGKLKMKLDKPNEAIKHYQNALDGLFPF